MMTAWQPPPLEKEVICRRYVQRVTGYSRAQVARLTGQYQKGSQISLYIGFLFLEFRIKSLFVDNEAFMPSF